MDHQTPWQRWLQDSIPKNIFLSNLECHEDKRQRCEILTMFETYFSDFKRHLSHWCTMNSNLMLTTLRPWAQLPATPRRDAYLHFSGQSHKLDVGQAQRKRLGLKIEEKQLGQIQFKKMCCEHLSFILPDTCHTLKMFLAFKMEDKCRRKWYPGCTSESIYGYDCILLIWFRASRCTHYKLQMEFSPCPMQPLVIRW